MKWYIGQPIVAIRNHSQGIFKKGQEFSISGIRLCPCGCNMIQIDISIKSGTEWECDKSKYREHTAIWWLSERNFAPLDQDISELTEILTKKETA